MGLGQIHTQETITQGFKRWTRWEKFEIKRRSIFFFYPMSTFTSDLKMKKARDELSIHKC